MGVAEAEPGLWRCTWLQMTLLASSSRSLGLRLGWEEAEVAPGVGLTDGEELSSLSAADASASVAGDAVSAPVVEMVSYAVSVGGELVLPLGIGVADTEVVAVPESEADATVSAILLLVASTALLFASSVVGVTDMDGEWASDDAEPVA